ncbi:MAG: hypothetical protein CVU77_05165 [Elusimicrobia bacterium HGW-Elusimicrobia-1]|nr:MAG: hypothetical protein CVU77_05165 [Elusimicrobia bacterium HGW-Elusimicrobia-1]
MNKKLKSALWIAAGVLWTLSVFALRGAFDARKMRLLEEEKRILLMWMENRHGTDWAKRVASWAEHKAADRVERFKKSPD